MAFCVALVAVLVYKRRLGVWRPGLPLETTDREIAWIGSRLVRGVSWYSNGSDMLQVKKDLVDRLKSSPARRLSLLREEYRGRREHGETVGVPSRYEVTGLLRFIGYYDRDAGPAGPLLCRLARYVPRPRKRPPGRRVALPRLRRTIGRPTACPTGRPRHRGRAWPPPMAARTVPRPRDRAGRSPPGVASVEGAPLEAASTPRTGRGGGVRRAGAAALPVPRLASGSSGGPRVPP